MAAGRRAWCPSRAALLFCRFHLPPSFSATAARATRDNRSPDDLLPRLRKWADLMLQLQKEDGHWYVEGKSNEPYTLTGSATVLTLIRAGQLLNDPACFAAVKKYLDAMNAENKAVLGTH